jgi:hypothetical protein
LNAAAGSDGESLCSYERVFSACEAVGDGLKAVVLGLPSNQAPNPVTNKKIMSPMAVTTKLWSARSHRSNDLVRWLVLILVFRILAP